MDVASSSRNDPDPPETWSAIFRVVFSFTPATMATGGTMRVGLPVTVSSSTLVAVAPSASETVTVIGITLSGAFGSVCRMAMLPSDFGTTVTGSDGLTLRASLSTRGSPSGSTHPVSAATVVVPPAETAGVGHFCTQACTPHHTGAVLVPSGTTVRVTVAGGDIRVPSVTVYEKVAEPDCARTRTTASWSLEIRLRSPNDGSLRPAEIEPGTIVMTSFLFGS